MLFLWTTRDCGIQSEVAASKVRIINSKLENLQEKLCPSDSRVTVLLRGVKETHWCWQLDLIPHSSHLKSILWVGGRCYSHWDLSTGQCPYVIALSLSFLFFPGYTKFSLQIPRYLSILISQPTPYSVPGLLWYRADGSAYEQIKIVDLMSRLRSKPYPIFQSSRPLSPLCSLRPPHPTHSSLFL